MILEAITIAHKMKECYDTKVKHFAFDPATDPYVKLVHQWMPNNKNNALLAATECIKAWTAKHPDQNDGMIILGFMAAAYYIVEVEPHKPKNISAHDSIMLNALRTVKFGHFNSSDGFVKDITAGGVRTARQRWWLTTLVVRHRKQIGNQAAVQTAERWLKDNPEPTATGHDQEPAKEAPAPVAPPAQETPNLFS